MSCAQAFGRACSSCGAEAPTHARFCVSCAAPLDSATPAPTPTPAPQPSPALPASFAGGRYQVKGFLGEGGRKRVYLAHDARLGRDVAVGVIKTDGLDADGLARVQREAQAMGRLGDHPHIVTIFDIGEEGGQPYIVSQYMEGGDLQAQLRQAKHKGLSLADAVRITNEVRQALEHAHSRGIIHRDLKPGNIWLTQDGTAKLGDFGLAISLERSRLTLEGMMVGTVAYMPPEQALGRQPDARSDLYSLGCVMYEMVTGRPPFLGDDAVAIISQHINTAPVAPSWHNPAVPRALEALILRLLAKAPEDRPDSAAAIPPTLTAIMETAATAAGQTVEKANPLDRLAGGVFVGREKEMDELQAGLEDALSGRGRLLMLVGEPGIGKTRTSDELATYARLRNAQVLWGRCYEGEGAPAYWPWVQVIRSYVHDRDPKALRSEMGPGAADIAQVVSEVKERLPGLPAPASLEPEQARFRLFDSITTFLKNASKNQPLVVVLDDLHWADKPSLLLLQFLARELRGARLLVLATYRDVELGRQHPLVQTLGELNREGLTQRILLRGLTERDVSRFIEITSGAPPPEGLVQAVYRETEGNPFFVNEIVRLLVSDGRLARSAEVKSWSVTLPQSVREVVGRRLNHLSEECNRVLTTASVAGREFGLDVLQEVTALPAGELLGLLEEAVAARVIAEVPRAAGRYTFSHALIRETLYEELTTARRLQLHREIGRALEDLCGSKPEPHLAALAHHFLEAAQGGDAEKAIDYATRAGHRAMSLTAYEEAASYYERALQTIDLMGKPDEARRCDLLLALGDALDGTGNAEGVRETMLMAADLARALQSGERLARAALGFVGRWVGIVEIGKYDEPLVGLLEEALDELGEADSALRARLLGRLATELYYSPDSYERRDQLSRQALEMGRRLSDPLTLADVLRARHVAVWGPENVEERLALAAEAMRLAEQAGDEGLLTMVLNWYTVDLLEVGKVEVADREFEKLAKLAKKRHVPLAEWGGALHLAMRALMDGRLEEGERFAQQALTAGQGPHPQTALLGFGAQMATLRVVQGRLGEVEGIFRAFAAQYPAIPALQWTLTYFQSELGRHAEAKSGFERLAANDFIDVPRDSFWLGTLDLAAEVCGTLGDVRRAAILYELLLPYARHNVVHGLGAVCFGSVSRLLGRLAGTMERWEEATRHFEDALEMNSGMGARPWVALTQNQYADMLLRRGGRGDREEALAQLSRSLDTAQEIGMKALVETGLKLKLQAQGIDISSLQTSIDTVLDSVHDETLDLRPHAAPDGTVTIMFSDIEGSTAMAERLGDKRFMVVLREHNAVVRQQLKAHGGFEVKSEGDGFMVAFQSARRALECAIDIQRALAARSNGTREPVRVRMGLHTGETIKEGEDFFGKNVVLAARLASQATGGEILVSSVLKALVDSAGDLAWGESRTVELKGLSGAHEVWPVVWQNAMED